MFVGIYSLMNRKDSILPTMDKARDFDKKTAV